MKTIDEIRLQLKLSVNEVAENGGRGMILLGKVVTVPASVIFSWGAGWDHVSVSPLKKTYTPTWADMCQVRDTFFRPEETVLQYHPAQSQYVNQLGNCLHLWRPQRYEIPLPPTALVGAKKGQTWEELMAALAEAEKNPYALTSGMLDGTREGTK